MTSQNKIESNRQNSKKSTGPVTVVGKGKSAMNALTHGLRSTWAPIIPGEELQAWESHRNAIVQALGPVGPLEVELAERAALLFWRLHRVTRYESMTVELAIQKETKNEFSFMEPKTDQQIRGANAIPRMDSMDKILRYESHISRQLQLTLNTLERTQARRAGADVSPPAALDVTLSD